MENDLNQFPAMERTVARWAFGLLFVAVGVVMSSGCVGGTGATMDRETVRRAIDLGNSEWIESFRAGDARRLANIFDASGVMLGKDGQYSRGRDEIRKAIFKTMNKFGPTETTITTDGLWVVEDVAYETGRYTYSFTSGDGPNTVLRGRYIAHWRRQTDDRWKIEMDLGLPD